MIINLLLPPNLFFILFSWGPEAGMTFGLWAWVVWERYCFCCFIVVLCGLISVLLCLLYLLKIIVHFLAFLWVTCVPPLWRLMIWGKVTFYCLSFDRQALNKPMAPRNQLQWIMSLSFLFFLNTCSSLQHNWQGQWVGCLTKQTLLLSVMSSVILRAVHVGVSSNRCNHGTTSLCLWTSGWAVISKADMSHS